MKYEKIDGKDRVWVVKRGPDGKLTDQLDLELLAALRPDLTHDELIIAAGTADIAETRAW